MKTITKEGRALAIVAGAAFVYGGLRIILGDTLTDLSQWDTSVQLTVLTVFGTIAAGHLLNDARRARHWFAVAGFAALFLSGTGLVVFNSVGRQAESSMLTEAQAIEHAKRKLSIEADKVKDEGRLSDAKERLAKECATGKGSKCAGIKETISVYEAAVKGHVSDLAALGTQKPVNAKAVEGAKIAALFGADEAKAKAALMLLEPFLWTMFFEIGSIVSLGFAFRRGPVAISEEGQFSDDDLGGLRKLLDGTPPQLPPTNAVEYEPKGSEVIEWAKAFEKKHGRAPRLDEATAAFPSISRSTVYRRLCQAA